MIYSGNVNELWREFSEAILEGVLPADTHLVLYNSGACRLLWSGSGLKYRFATFDLARNWLIEQSHTAWESRQAEHQAAMQDCAGA
jgi:hypothetical protein